MAHISPLQFNKLPSSSPSLAALSLTSTATISPTNLYILISTNRNRNRKTTHSQQLSKNEYRSRIYSRRASIVEDSKEEEGSFEEAVELFNEREYYKCHDFLEPIWNHSQEPIRTLVHAILQCAVAFHHLFNQYIYGTSLRDHIENLRSLALLLKQLATFPKDPFIYLFKNRRVHQNHKGAMMELGEGLCKLRKMNLDSGPFYEFEKEISAVLDFIYQTQLELAACTDDFCVTLDQSERSYKLLGGYAAGQRVYSLENDVNDCLYIVFCPTVATATSERPRVKLPVLNASEEHLLEFEYD